MRQATGLRSLAKASQPSLSASSGIDPPPAKGSTISGGSEPRAAFTSARLTSRYVLFVPRSQFAKLPMNLSNAFRRSSSVVPGLQPPTCGKKFRACFLNSTGQSGSTGSGQRSPSNIARLDASGRRAHHKCIRDGWPCGRPFSFTASLDTSAIGKSTSARRLQSLGIMNLFRRAPGLHAAPSTPSSRSPKGSSARPSSPRSRLGGPGLGPVPAGAETYRSR